MFVPLQSQCSPKAQTISNWFLEHDNELTVLKWANTDTRAQFNRGSLGYGETGLDYEYSADRSAEMGRNYMMLLHQYEPKPLENFPATS